MLNAGIWGVANLRGAWTGTLLIAVACNGHALEREQRAPRAAEGSAGDAVVELPMADQVALVTPDPSPTAVAVEIRASTPAPRTCDGGTEPSVIARPLAIAGIQIAVSDGQVYWNDGAGIMRTSTHGGEVEKFADSGPGGYGIRIVSGGLYWQREFSLVTLPLEGGAVRVLANRVAPGAWAVGGGRAFYANSPVYEQGAGGVSGTDVDRASISWVPLSGGSPSVIEEGLRESALGSFGADATGGYWHYRAVFEPGSGGSAGERPSGIYKFSTAMGAVGPFADAQTLDWQRLIADGTHVVWAEGAYPRATTIWSRKPDGADGVWLGSAPLVRGLALDESSVYWAASDAGDEYSDILATPVAGGPTRVVACHVESVYGLAASGGDLFYFTYTAEPIIARLSVVLASRNAP